jgi:hypothetical protein
VVLSLNKALAENELDVAYRLIPAVDLSRQILAPLPHRLLAVRDRTSGWADLGTPTRVMDILARNNIRPSCLGDVPSGYRYAGGHDKTGNDLAAAALKGGKDFQG